MHKSSMDLGMDGCYEGKENIIHRLDKIEGKVRRVKGLLEKSAYCDDIITQISATQLALNSIARNLLENHLKNCIVESIIEGKSESFDEVLATIQKLAKK